MSNRPKIVRSENLFLGDDLKNASQETIKELDLCMVTEFFDEYIHYPKLLVGRNFRSEGSCAMEVIWGPCFEELVDRVILQEILLKKLPKKLLQKKSCLQYKTG